MSNGEKQAAEQGTGKAEILRNDQAVASRAERVADLRVAIQGGMVDSDAALYLAQWIAALLEKIENSSANWDEPRYWNPVEVLVGELTKEIPSLCELAYSAPGAERALEELEKLALEAAS